MNGLSAEYINKMPIEHKPGWASRPMEVDEWSPKLQANKVTLPLAVVPHTNGIAANRSEVRQHVGQFTDAQAHRVSKANAKSLKK